MKYKHDNVSGVTLPPETQVELPSLSAKLYNTVPMNQSEPEAFQFCWDIRENTPDS